MATFSIRVLGQPDQSVAVMATGEIAGCSALDTSSLTQIMEEPSIHNLNRRSLSIFSRRGVSTPKPVIDRMPSIVSRPTPNTQRRTSIMFRARNKQPQIPEGTILRAVPPAVSSTYAARSMSTLEFEMATSPNDEILSAIGSPSMPTSPVTPRTPYSATPSSDRLPKKKSISLRHSSKRSRAQLRPDDENVIGLWKEGQTKWTQESSRPTTKQEAKVMAPVLEQPVSVQTPKDGRPQIRVIIPGHRLNAPLPFLPFFAAPGQSYSSVEATISAGSGDSPVADIPPGKIRRTSIVSQTSSMTLVPHQPQPLRPAPHTPQRLANAQQPATVIADHPRPSLRKSSSSSEDSSSNNEDEYVSNYSRSARTSMTSVGSDKEVYVPKSLGKRTGSQAFSILSPAAAGIYDDVAIVAGSPSTQHPEIAELPGSSPIEKCSLSRASSYSSPQRRRSGAKRMSSRRGTKVLSAPPRRNSEGPRASSPSLTDAENDLETTLGSIEERRTPVSPLAAHDNVELVELPAGPDVPPPPPPKSKRRPTVAYRQTKGPAITPATEIPKVTRAVAERSRTLRDKRRELRSRSVRRKKSYSLPDLEQLALVELPEMEEHFEEQRRIAAQREITSKQAEQVILRIMESLADLDDLFNTAMLNKGFYRVYKKHEMALLWNVLRTASPSAWEFMQVSQSSPIAEHLGEAIVESVDFTPISFVQTLTKAEAVLGGFKNLIHSKCQCFLRPSTVDAMVESGTLDSKRANAALWRIFSFSRIFASSRSRDDDITGQMDWLRGGALAHQQMCTSTIFDSDSFGLSDVLLNASEHFGRGNGANGLSAEELYDMTELWNCIIWLVRGLESKTEQARQFGIFDKTDVRGGDIDGEETMLEEYASYILTLGLEPVLTIANALHPSHEATLDELVASSRPFAIARDHGWTKWTPPMPGASRSNFLKEPLTRLYEERIQAELAASERQAAEAQKEEMKEVRRARGQSFAEEIKRSRQSFESEHSASSRPTRLVDERPMSDWELVLTKFANGEIASINSAINTPSDRSIQTKTPDELEKLANTSTGRSSPETLMSTSSAPQKVFNKEFGPSSSRSSSPRLQHAPGTPHSSDLSLTISSATSLSDIHPAFRDQVAHSRAVSRETDSSGSAPSRKSVAFTQHPIQTQLVLNADGDVDTALNTSELAISRIVEMGFTTKQARYSLMKTDMGDGLNIDRAVELLLRRGGPL